MILTVLINAQLPESTLVSKIIFQGNKTFKTKLLKNLIFVKEKELFDGFYLEKDLNTLILLYQNQGFKKVYITNEVKSSPKGKVIYYKIVEGSRTRISLIKLSGIVSFPETKIQSLLKIKNGDYLITSKIEDAEQTIINWYKNSGFPYIEIERKVVLEDDIAIVNFLVTEGPITYIKEIKIRGNQKVSDAIIIRTSEIKLGEKFSLERLERARQRLYGTKLFERVSFYVLDTSNKDSLVIRFDVLELPARSISFGLGIQTPPTRLIFSSEWEHSNFLSRGHNLLFSVGYAPTFSGDWRSEINNLYRIFYILKTPINFSVQPSFKYEIKDAIKRSDLNVDAGLYRYFGFKFEIGTFLRYLRVWTNQTLDLTSPQKSITNSQNFYLHYDTRDNFFTPARGIFFSTNFQFAGSIFDGDNDFYKTQTEIALFKKIPLQLVFGGRIMTGLAIPYHRTLHVPYFEEFSIGGNNGLRGYDEKAIGPDSIGKEHYGEAISNVNLELRTNFEKLIDFVIFSDIGKVTERKVITDLNLKTYHYSTGVGLRINTPIGPIRLDYAKRLKDRPSGDWGKIHLALLNAF